MNPHDGRGPEFSRFRERTRLAWRRNALSAIMFSLGGIRIMTVLGNTWLIAGSALCLTLVCALTFLARLRDRQGSTLPSGILVVCAAAATVTVGAIALVALLVEGVNS